MVVQPQKVNKCHCQTHAGASLKNMYPVKTHFSQYVYRLYAIPIIMIIQYETEEFSTSLFQQLKPTGVVVAYN